MKIFSTAALVLLAASPAFAAAPEFTLDFEKNWDYLNGSVDGYYGGGMAADGSTGADLGVVFVGVSGLSNDADFTYYSNATTPVGVAYAYDTAYMNVAAGVSNVLTFSYASPESVVGAIKAFSGLNGTGALLGAFDLVANSTAYDNWTTATFTFAGTAQSFDLSATANIAAIDNISSVPESSTWLLMLAGCAAVLRIGSRRRA